ncbi:MAG TPA: hypothetical protein VHQ90_10815 [Thermoanaerobaculia bacterium]|nr:hypothetical protein [Thermoanaerobaculia bacterium]
MQTKERQSGVDTPRKILRLLLLAGSVALVWAGTWYFLSGAREMTYPDGRVLTWADRGSILFGTATVSSVLFSLLIAAIALFGFRTLKDSIQRDIEAKTTQRIKDLETEMHGRVLSTLGHSIGTLNSEPDQPGPTNKDRLAEAIWNCQKGYDLLKEVGGRPMLMGLNNLVYYSCVFGDPARGRYLLQQARVLRDAGDEYGSPDLLLTFCRAVLQYGTDHQEIEEARTIAEGLLRAKLNELQEKEARFYLAALPRKGTPSP